VAIQTDKTDFFLNNAAFTRLFDIHIQQIMTNGVVYHLAVTIWVKNRGKSDFTNKNQSPRFEPNSNFWFDCPRPLLFYISEFPDMVASS
jgi:hypothetical protein